MWTIDYDMPAFIAGGPVECPRPMNPQSRLFDETPPYPAGKSLANRYEPNAPEGYWGWTWNRAGTKKIKVWIPNGDVR